MDIFIHFLALAFVLSRILYVIAAFALVLMYASFFVHSSCLFLSFDFPLGFFEKASKEKET